MVNNNVGHATLNYWSSTAAPHYNTGLPKMTGINMTSNWQQWQGRTIAGKYVAEDYLGGSEQSAVFRTNFEGQPAVLKLISVTPAGAERRLALWKRAAAFSHPNLIGIFDYGRLSEEDREFLYIVEEFAEENLSQILPERALTAEEVRGMLPPMLDAVESIHSKNLVHSRIHPANILAIGDQVKLSSDSLRPAGDISRAATPYDAPEATIKGLSAASDVWSLGMTLAEVLTQRLPSADAAGKGGTMAAAVSPIPEPLRTIIRRCVETDPAARCTIGEIRERLAGRASHVGSAVARPAASEKAASIPVAASDGPKSFKWQYAAAAAILVAAALFIFRSHSSNSGSEEASTPPSPAQTTQSTTNAPERSSEEAKGQAKAQRKDQAPESSKPSAAATSRASERAAQPAAEATPSNRAERTNSDNDVAERAMPQVSPGARHTIHGKIKVRVQVSADAAGNVTQANLKTAGPSKYFARAALEAARKWKFAPASGAQTPRPRSWLITFGFTRGRTEASATPAR